MIFKNPWILFIIPFMFSLISWFERKDRRPALRFPSADLVAGLSSTWKVRLHRLPFYLRLAALVLFVAALSGPRSVLEETTFKSEGIDIVLSVDASGSMAAEDFTINGKRMNRLAVVKDVVKDFIKGRKHDRIGLIAFGGRAYTVSPLTTDYDWLQTNLDRVELDLLEDGTAVGSAVSSALSRLKESRAKSKAIILLTDGVNNAGTIDPRAAARAAKALGIKIYTIGAGTDGYAPFPVKDLWGRSGYQRVKIEIDEAMLKEVATITGGMYFRATDTDSLREIYKQIDSLEKTEIEETSYKEYRELFVYVLAAALALLLLEVLLANTVLLRIP